MSCPLDILVGKKINAVYINDRFLRFDFDGVNFIVFTVEGDCCSHSYFYDFYGVKKLLDNGPVISVREIALEDPEIKKDEDGYCAECTRAYGFELVTESREFGEQTSVVSFRNDSNGYYGGWMEACKGGFDPKVEPQVFDDVVEVHQP